jgi:peptidoglycan/LPS O-acetylase OafA/YrhL
MALGRLFVLEQAGERRGRGGGALALMGSVGFFGLTQLNEHLPFVLLHNSLPSPFHALLIYGLARGGWLARPLGSRVFVFLGDISYAIYILQAPVANVVAQRFPLRGEWEAVWRNHVTYWLVLFVVSTIAFRWFERPAREFLRRRLSAPTPSKTATGHSGV